MVVNIKENEEKIQERKSECGLAKSEEYQETTVMREEVDHSIADA